MRTYNDAAGDGGGDEQEITTDGEARSHVGSSGVFIEGLGFAPGNYDTARKPRPARVGKGSVWRGVIYGVDVAKR
jgi:hypothetical protein